MKPHKKFLIIVAAFACLLEAYMLFYLGILDSYFSRNALYATFIIALAAVLTMAHIIRKVKYTDLEEKKSDEHEKVQKFHRGIMCPSCGESNVVWRDVCISCGTPLRRTWF